MNTSDKKVQKNINDIHKDLLGDNSLACMFAIRYCVLNKITDNETISIIKNLKGSKLIEWNSCKIADCAVAALHLLGVEKYEGENYAIKDLIDTVFFTNIQK